MDRKFIFGFIVAILLLMPLVSAFSISGLFNWITGKAAAFRVESYPPYLIEHDVGEWEYGSSHQLYGGEKSVEVVTPQYKAYYISEVSEGEIVAQAKTANVIVSIAKNETEKEILANWLKNQLLQEIVTSVEDISRDGNVVYLVHYIEGLSTGMSGYQRFTYMWISGYHLIIVMEEEPTTPYELVDAYLAQYPSDLEMPVVNCSKLLLEHDIGAFNYSFSSVEFGTVDDSEYASCQVIYDDVITEKQFGGYILVHKDKADAEKNLIQILKMEEDFVFGPKKIPYNGQIIYQVHFSRDMRTAYFWTNINYIIMAGEIGDLPKGLIELKEPNKLVDVYLERYPSSLPACTDTDGGKDYYIKGTVYGIDAGENEYEDKCVDDELIEHYCELNEATSEYFLCPEGCEDGACIREKCESDADCTGILVYILCPIVIGRDKPKCNVDTGECYCGGVCGDDYCDSYERPSETCPTDCEPACVPEWECKVTPPFCPPSGKQTKICKDVECGLETKKEDITCIPGQCSGCLHDTTCVPYGHRLKVKDISAYCSIDSVLRPQMPEGAACENDYECKTNECGNGECISTYSLLQKIWELLKAVFGKGWLWGK